MGALAFGASLSLRQRRIGGVGFEFAGALPAGATLTRAGPAGRHDASGAFVVEAPDVARFDHDPVTGQSLGLLIEPQRGNMLLHSGDLSVSAWAKAGMSAPAATQAIETAAGGGHYLTQTGASFAAGVVYTSSFVIADLGTGAKRYPQINGSSLVFGAQQRVAFDPANGAVLLNGGATGGIAALDGGFWRIWMTAAATAGGTGSLLRLYLADTLTATATPSYAGDGVSGLRVAHAQIEEGVGVTSRIDTAAAAGTRAADVLMLNWGGRGVGDGAVIVRYTFDDGSTQEVATTIAGGVATVPTTLARARLRRAALV